MKQNKSFSGADVKQLVQSVAWATENANTSDYEDLFEGLAESLQWSRPCTGPQLQVLTRGAW